MKYKIDFSRVESWCSCAEVVAGPIPDKIWRYIQDECDGDFSTYSEMLNDGEVPAELMLSEDGNDLSNCDSFFRKHAPLGTSSNTRDCDETIVISDAETNEITAEVKVSDIEREADWECADESTPYFVWTSEEKGCFYVLPDGVEAIETDEEPEPLMIETDKPFDVSKLKLHIIIFNYDAESREFPLITSVEYDGKFYKICSDASHGIGSNVEVFGNAEDEDDDEDEE